MKPHYANGRSNSVLQLPLCTALFRATHFGEIENIRELQSGSFGPKMFGFGVVFGVTLKQKRLLGSLKSFQSLSSLELTEGCKVNSDLIHFTSCWRKQELNLFRAALELALGASRGVGLGEGGLLALRATAQHSWLSVCPFWDISWPQTSFALSLGPVCSQEQLHKNPGYRSCSCMWARTEHSLSPELFLFDSHLQQKVVS